MKLKQRISLATILLAIIPLLIANILANYIASNSSLNALEQTSKDKLISLRNTKTSEIESYFSTIENQIINLSRSEVTRHALTDFIAASNMFATQTNQSNRYKTIQQLSPYYNDQFDHRYAEKNYNEHAPDSKILMDKIDDNGLALQNTYIAQNKAPLGEKDSLITADDGSMYDHYHSQYHPYLRDFLQRFGYYDIFLVDAESGNIVYTVFKELDFATSLKTGPYANSGIGEAFRLAMQGEVGNSYIVDFKPYIPSYNDPASFIATPIEVDGVKKGVLIFQMPINRINDIMTFNKDWGQAGLGDSGEIYLVGEDATLRSQSRFFVEDPTGFFNALEQSNHYDKNVINLMKTKEIILGLLKIDSVGSREALAGKTDFTVLEDYRGIKVLSAYAPLNIHGLNWAILAEVDESEAYHLAYELIEKLWVYGLISLVILASIATMISMRLSNSISNPIIHISQFIAEVGNHLDLTKRLNLNRNDEIGEASQSLNKMLDSVQKALAEVTDSSVQIASAAEETSTVTEQTSQAVQSQRAQTEQVASAMTEMTATANTVAENIHNASLSAYQASEQVTVGLSSMEQTMDRITRVEELTHSACDTINQLKQSTLDITSIVDVINNVAEQTNLLALNAAIEAARAGEYGRGFAVVADEVRSLASKTTRSTSEITDMIEKLQQGANKAVTSIDKSVGEVHQAVEQAQSTGEALNVISQLIQQINEMSSQIATAAEEQGAVSEDINKNIVTINDMTSQTATGAIETSKASQELAKLASDLSLVVKRFKTA